MANRPAILSTVDSTLRHLRGVLEGKRTNVRSFDPEHAQMVVSSMRTMLDAAYYEGKIDWDTYENYDNWLMEITDLLSKHLTGSEELSFKEIFN